MEEIKLEYLGQTKDSQNGFICWNHPNYTTFIHTKDTPLGNKFDQNSKEMLDDPMVYRIVMLGAVGVGRSAFAKRFVTESCFALICSV